MKNKILKIFLIIQIFLNAPNAYSYDMLLDDFSIQNDMFTRQEIKQERLELIPTSDTQTMQTFENNKQISEKELIAPKKTTDIEVYSDDLQYYPERNEFEATGNAYVFIPQENATMWADRLVFNKETNTVKGYGNVTIKRINNTATGDYIQINLKEKNALLEKPILEEYNVKIIAKDSKFYPGKLTVEEGTITTQNNMQFKIGATTFGNFFDPTMSDIDKNSIMKEKFNSEYTIKAKIIEVNSLENNDEMVLKGADIYLKNIKIASAPKLRFLTDKAQHYVESNTPEISSLKQFGLFFGPGYVFNLPKSATLKVAPVVVYGNSEWGIGGIGRFRTATNVTEAAWGSAKKDWIIRGKQKFNDNLWLDYSYNGYMNEWFYGDRVPGKLIQLVYHKDHFLPHNMRYSHRISAGYATDKDTRWGTGRYRYQGHFSQNVFSRVNQEKRRGLHLGYNVDGAMTVYGSGETNGIIKGGPYIRTELNNWVSHIGYNFGGVHGKTPFLFDRYMYGKQQLYIIETLRVNKYVSLAYSATLALLKDNWENKMLQENRFFIVLGPEDAKLNFGYDTVRQRTIMNFQLAIGTENTKVEFDKLVVKNPDNIGNEKETKIKHLKEELQYKFMKIFLPDEAEEYSKNL